LLLWIMCSLSPTEIRERLLDDSDFRVRLLAWLEQCHSGDFATGSKSDIEERIRLSRSSSSAVSSDTHAEDLHVDESRTTESYRDPTLNLPSSPDPLVFTNDSLLGQWFRDMQAESDDIVFRSNQHSQTHSKGCKRITSSVCRARYPRELFDSTVVDPDTGAIRFKKSEPWINTFNHLLSYLLRCNTDVTCLLSGTTVKAVIAYVTDYISKAAYTTQSVFSSVKSV
ncbi:hypothetical protein FOMPIDRAFT_1107569, partial [Fomitopsis schrenkii]